MRPAAPVAPQRFIIVNRWEGVPRPTPSQRQQQDVNAKRPISPREHALYAVYALWQSDILDQIDVVEVRGQGRNAAVTQVGTATDVFGIKTCGVLIPASVIISPWYGPYVTKMKCALVSCTKENALG